MSEPMSSVEIEDVLSSIRRLVSEDLRPSGRVAQPAAPAQPAPAPAPVAEKLVLTPALRIVPEPAPEPAAPPPETQHSVEDAPYTDVHDDEGIVSLQGYEDDGAAAPLGMTATIPEALFAAPQPQDVPLDEAAQSDDAMALDMAALAEVAASADHHAEARAEARADDWAEQAEAAIRAELERETTEGAYARFLDEEDAPVFDEAAMRDLVRDIIREELQGTLGERITRNVRKLVRAEVARALAVRDFD